MNIKFSLVAFVFILATVYVYASNQYQDKATEDAANLVTKYTLSDDKDKGLYLKKLADITERYPDNKNVRSMYANILLAEKNYPSGLNQLKLVNKDNPTPVSKLTECMLVERNGQNAENCYKDSVSLFEKSHKHDDNYVIALYLSGDQKYHTAKDKLMDSGKLNDSQKKLFSMSRKELIESIFP